MNNRELLEWAVGRWRAEVERRPMVNRQRRSLDDTWRQVIRFAGGEPDSLIGPSHDALMLGGRKVTTAAELRQQAASDTSCVGAFARARPGR